MIPPSGILKSLRVIAILLTGLAGPMLSSTATHAQNNPWSLGARVGVNALFNNFNVRKPGPGLDAVVRYSLSPRFSFGATVGYEELKSHLDPNTEGLPFDYIKLHAFPFSVVGWYHPMPQEQLSPYVYLGIGGMLFQRIDGLGNGLPDKNIKSSIHIPIGAGVLIPTTKNMAVDVDVGYRILNDDTETIDNGGVDSYLTLKAGVSYFFSRGDPDDDGDGLMNSEELELGTNPTKADTDMDRLGDGDEVRLYQTHPLKTDSDNDAIADGDEVLVHTSDPTEQDSDKDLLNDGAELKHGTDLMNPDSDGDRLLDGEEIEAGSNPLVMDSDNDALSDYDELRIYGTDVNDPDTDQDGLGDGEEIADTGTDPLSRDTDRGGTPDGLEVERATDPLDPSDDMEAGPVLETGKAMVIEGITFLPGSASISGGSEEVLEKAFLRLIVMPNSVEIIGHTDNTGDTATNDRLSLERAEAVKEWLARKGIQEYRLSAVGRGSNEPITTNETDEGRARNRRIEFYVIPKGVK